MDKFTERTHITPDPILMMELKKLGLSSRESFIYLLVMGAQSLTASSLALYAKLSRPTIYRTLDSLTEKKLINKIKKNKKTLFVATPPHALLSLLKIKRREVEEQEREFLRIISLLQNTYASTHEQNMVHTYKHNNHFNVLRDDIITTAQKKLHILVGTQPTKHIPHILPYIYKNVHIYTPHLAIKELSCSPHPSGIKSEKMREQLCQKNVPLKGNMPTIVVTNRIFIIDNQHVMTITHTDLCSVFSTLFDLLWHIADDKNRETLITTPKAM